MNALFILFFLSLAAAVEQRTIYGQQAYEVTDNQKLREVGDLLKAQPETANANGGLMHLLHATLHMNLPPSYKENNVMVNELHPPVKVTAQVATKARKVPHRDAEATRRITAGSVLVALATTPDMLWVQVGANQYVPTKHLSLEEPLRREQPVVSRLVPPLEVHARGPAVVRKIPDIGGKPVARLAGGELLTAEAVTADYAWLMLGPNQFIPTAAVKLGDPSTPLLPPLTIHMKRDTVVREGPRMDAKAVTTLTKGDIMQALAVSSDLMWLKLAHHSYVRTFDCKLGLPLPPVVDFPRPLTVTLLRDAQVIKNPHHPEAILRWLHKDDELQAFGATADMKYLVVAKKRFIPMDAAKIKSALPEPLPLSPPVPIKMSRAVEVRNQPSTELGKIVMMARAGDKYDASAVSAEFDFLMIGEGLWIPMTAAFFSTPPPATSPLVPPMKVTVLKDTKARKRPDHYAKVIKVFAEGDTVTAIATTADLAWLKVGDKLYIPTDEVRLEDPTLLAPLFPALKAVLTRDTVVRKAPNDKALPVRRLKRGEVLDVHETTTDMMWLKLGENEFVETAAAAHVQHTVPLTPPVKVVVAADIAVRGVPSFAGMPVRNITKGEVLIAKEATPDNRWLLIAKDQYVPASGCVLHDSEGKDMGVVLKIRSKNVDKSGQQRREADAAPSPRAETSAIAKLVANAVATGAKTEAPAPVADLKTKISQLRVKEDTLVMSRPDPASTPVRGIKKGELVDATGLGTNLVWLKIDDGAYIKLAATEPVK